MTSNRCNRAACSYLIIASTPGAVLIDPSSLADRYAAVAAHHGMRIWHHRYAHARRPFPAAPAGTARCPVIMPR
jgi:hypothetical protein